MDPVIEGRRYMTFPLDSVYPAYAKQKGFEPTSVTMKDGLKGYWIGDPKSEDVLIWFHGLNSLSQLPSHPLFPALFRRLSG